MGKTLMTKKAIITGISGQDGSYLAELLLQKGYEVHGVIRRHSTPATSRIDHIFNDLHLHYGDVTDASSTENIITEVEPEEIYNLAAQSHVRTSFDVPAYTAQSTGVGTLNILEAIKWKGIKFYQASSSELYGGIYGAATNETVPFHPRSPYAIAKLFAYWSTVNHREAYGTFACNGILFNHESPRRGETFVTKKITKAAARIKLGLQDKLFLGNLDARRDWGYAPEYVEGMWRMLQQDKPNDYVLATGKTHTIRDFLDAAFEVVNLDWKKYVEIDPKYFRPTEVDLLVGDASKAKRVLGWEAKTDMKDLAYKMVMHDWRECDPDR
jgi:GDPmannose 4,6-dehydratase